MCLIKVSEFVRYVDPACFILTLHVDGHLESCDASEQLRRYANLLTKSPFVVSNAHTGLTCQLLNPRPSVTVKKISSTEHAPGWRNCTFCDSQQRFIRHLDARKKCFAFCQSQPEVSNPGSQHFLPIEIQVCNFSGRNAE